MNKKTNYNVIDSGAGVPVKAWTCGVPFEDGARKQVMNVASLPFINKWVAVMPDVHAGKGATIGSYFIELAKEDMRRWYINLPDKDLAYLPEGTEHFRDYVQAVDWAQRFAMANREIMMRHVIEAVAKVLPVEFDVNVEAVNCHHNYVAREHHYGKNVWVTRKGAVRACGWRIPIQAAVGAYGGILWGVHHD